MPRHPSDNVRNDAPSQDPKVLRWLTRLLRSSAAPSNAVQQAPEDATRQVQQVNIQDLSSREDLDAAAVARLDGIVRSRTAEIERARLAAEEAGRAKALFLANMSHELRTPMHAILSYAQLGRDASREDQTEYFDCIMQRGQLLLNLLNDLLDLSRLEAGSMSVEFAANDVEVLARDALTLAAASFNLKQVSVQISRAPDCASCRASVDAVLMGKLFENLLSNAARFSPLGGKVRVVLSCSTLSDGTRPRPVLEVAIVDEGVGIPESELELIFDKFVQSSKTRSNAGGTGLGLAICREIVALHGGRIWASNNQGPGATLHIVLPMLDDTTSTGRFAL
jgi:signal transduction histidine kinase